MHKPESFMVAAWMGVLAAACSSASDDVSPAGDGGATDGGRSDVVVPGGGGSCSFCDDFERADVKGAWDGLVTKQAGALELATDRPHAGAKALRISLSATSGSQASVTKKLTLGAGERLRLAYAFYLPANVDRTLTVLPLSFSGGGANVSLYLRLEHDKVNLVEQAFDASGKQTRYHVGENVAPAVGRWTDVVVEIASSSSAPSATLTYDGTTKSFSLEGGKPEGSFTLVGGVGYSSAGSAIALDVDDVRVETAP